MMTIRPFFLACLLFGGTALAEPKRDILGFYLGMTGADFLANAQKLGLRACRWQQFDANAGIPAAEPWPSIKIHCPNDQPGTARHTASFTRNLTPNVLVSFDYSFISEKTFEGVVADLSEQFGVRPKTGLPEYPPGFFDLGDGVMMRLDGGYRGSYRVVLFTSKYNIQDKEAGDEKRNRNAPSVKF